MADLRAVGVSIVTIGQYLRPTRDHLPVRALLDARGVRAPPPGGGRSGRGPRRGVTAHPVELPRQGGGNRGVRGTLTERAELAEGHRRGTSCASRGPGCGAAVAHHPRIEKAGVQP